MSGYRSSAGDRCYRLRGVALALLFSAWPKSSRAEPPAEPTRPGAVVSQHLSSASSVQAEEQSPPLFAYLVGAVGLSGLSVSAVTGFLAMNQQGIAEDHCSPTLRLCDGAGKQ